MAKDPTTDSAVEMMDALVGEGGDDDVMMDDLDMDQYNFELQGGEDTDFMDQQSLSTATNENRSISGGSKSTHTVVTTASVTEEAPTKNPLTGRPPAKLYLSCDPDTFSEYQVIVRQSIELFEASCQDVDTSTQGRNNPITLGQVGIRCRYCNMVPPSERKRGATYYPSKLSGLYQAAQNLAVSHLIENCAHVPQDVRANLIRLRDQKSAAGGGKMEWANRAHALGVFEEDNGGLRFADRIDAFASQHTVVYPS